MNYFKPRDFENLVKTIEADSKAPKSSFAKNMWLLPVTAIVSVGLAVFAPSFGAIWSIIVATVMQLLLLAAYGGIISLAFDEPFYGSFPNTIAKSGGTTRRSMVDWKFSVFVSMNHAVLLGISIYAGWTFLAFAAIQAMLFEPIVRKMFVRAMDVFLLQYTLDTGYS